MKMLVDNVQITADNTNVRSGRIKVPTWAKIVQIQLVAPDSDWLFSVTVAGVEYARDSGPNITAADNVEQSIDMTKQHILADNVQVETEILINVNVVTAGVGLLGVTFLDALR